MVSATNSVPTGDASATIIIGANPTLLLLLVLVLVVEVSRWRPVAAIKKNSNAVPRKLCDDTMVLSERRALFVDAAGRCRCLRRRLGAASPVEFLLIVVEGYELVLLVRTSTGRCYFC